MFIFGCVWFFVLGLFYFFVFGVGGRGIYLVGFINGFFLFSGWI